MFWKYFHIWPHMVMPYEKYGLIRESYNINSDLELSICFVYMGHIYISWYRYMNLLFDIMACTFSIFWRHDVLFDIMSYFLASWRTFFYIITYFLTSRRTLWHICYVITYFPYVSTSLRGFLMSMLRSPKMWKSHNRRWLRNGTSYKC